MLGSSATILVVEDDDIVRNIIVEYLKEHEFNPFTANDGMMGLQKARLQKFDVIITDIDMPRMNGIQLVDELRKVEINKETPIIVLSAFLNKEAVMDIKGLVQKILVKPIEMKELINTLKFFTE